MLFRSGETTLPAESPISGKLWEVAAGTLQAKTHKAAARTGVFIRLVCSRVCRYIDFPERGKFLFQARWRMLQPAILASLSQVFAPPSHQFQERPEFPNMNKRNAFYAQSGGVTAVINASACGVIETARRHRSKIGKVYAGRNGIIGALTEDLIDTSRESPAAIRALSHTPEIGRAHV